MSTGGRIYVYTVPAYRDTPWTGARRGRGLVKVGYTTRDPHTRIKEQIGASSPERVPYELLLVAPSRDRKGRPVTDKDLHHALAKAGVHRLRGEWFEARPAEVSACLSSLNVRVRRGTAPPWRRRKGQGPARWLWMLCATGILLTWFWPTLPGSLHDVLLQLLRWLRQAGF